MIAFSLYKIFLQEARQKETIESFGDRLNWTKDQLSEVLAIWIKTFHQGVSENDLITSDTYQEALEKATQRRNLFRKEEINKFVGSSSFRKHFVDRKPSSKKEEKYFDTIEVLIEVVEKYYDEKFFTLNSLKSQFMLLRQSDTKGKREGILVKQQPYSNHVTVNIFGVAEACYDVFEKYLEGTQLGLLIRFDSLPTKSKIIDYLCVKDVLEIQSPDGMIQTDTGQLPFWKLESFRPLQQLKQLNLFA